MPFFSGGVFLNTLNKFERRQHSRLLIYQVVVSVKHSVNFIYCNCLLEDQQAELSNMALHGQHHFIGPITNNNKFFLSSFENRCLLFSLASYSVMCSSDLLIFSRDISLTSLVVFNQSQSYFECLKNPAQDDVGSIWNFLMRCFFFLLSLSLFWANYSNTRLTTSLALKRQLLVSLRSRVLCQRIAYFE